MSVFIYYSDGYREDGDVGFHECSDMEEAEKFINDRLATRTVKNPSEAYIVIEGRRKQLKEVSVIREIRID